MILAQLSDNCHMSRNNVGPIECNESKSMVQAQVGQQKCVEFGVGRQMIDHGHWMESSHHGHCEQ